MKTSILNLHIMQHALLAVMLVLIVIKIEYVINV